MAPRDNKETNDKYRHDKNNITKDIYRDNHESIMCFSDYREILKDVLASKLKYNPAYSLRSFALHLEMNPSRLSEIFKKKEGLSRERAEKIAKKLWSSSKEISFFCDLVEAEHARSKAKKDLARIRLKKYRANADSIIKPEKMALDYFKIISDWYHFAILELTYLDCFQDNNKWIANSLNINVHLVDEAIKRLIRVGLLVKKNNHYVSTEDFSSVGGEDIPSDSIKRFHKQILEKAIQSLYLDPVSSREFGNIIFAFDKDKMEDAKNLIKLFKKEFLKKMSCTDTKKNSVYCFGIHFFPLAEDKQWSLL